MIQIRVIQLDPNEFLDDVSFERSQLVALISPSKGSSFVDDGRKSVINMSKLSSINFASDTRQQNYESSSEATRRLELEVKLKNSNE